MRLSTYSLILFITTTLFSGCSTEPAAPVEEISLAQHASSKYGMVASSHPLATHAGKTILMQGGNAADAAVATAFALAVVEPAMSGLGGRLQAIIRTADGEVHGIDATTQAPLTYDQETAPQAKYGYAVIGVPGMLAGLAKLNSKYGKLPLAELIEPAITLAEEGFYQLPDQARLQATVRQQLLEFEGSTQYFIVANDTVTYGPDNLLVQKDLARTLRLIAEQGPEVFYSGEIAEKMVTNIQAHGGAVTMESLAQYEARDAEIVTGSYRGKNVYGLWMPSFGAITIEILHILENFSMSEYNHAEWADIVYQAITLAYADRYRQDSLEVGYEITSKTYAKAQAVKIKTGMVTEANLGIVNEYLAWQANPGHTTHLSVADNDGMVVALTQSLLYRLT